MSIFTAAAADEDGDTIRQLREENEQLRQSLLNLHTVLEMTAKAGAHHARAAECLRDAVIRWATRAEQAEDMLGAIGAGGVGKLEQPQSVTDCHQSQPKGEPLTDDAATRLVQSVVAGSDRPIGMVAFGLLVARAIESAHGIGGDA